MTRWSIGAATAVLACLGFTVPASAVELSGVLNIGGSVSVSATTIDWFPFVDGNNFNVVAPSSGYFADPGNGGGAIYQPNGTVEGVAQNLNSAVTPTGVPVNVPNFLSGFTGMTNSEYADLNFTLTEVEAATAPTCVGNIAVNTSCSIGPFTLTQTATNALAVSMNLMGIFNDTSLGISSLAGIGTYSTQSGLLGSSTGAIITNVQGVLDEIFGRGGSISASYSATYNVPGGQPVPEPATLMLLGTGLLGLGVGSKRRRARTNQ